MSSANAWLAQLMVAKIGGAEEVPKGWETAQEIAVHMDRSLSRTNNLLTRWVGDGSAEKKSFRIKRGERILPIPHYRIKKPS